MNKSIIKVKLFILSFLIVGSVFAQQKLTKISQTIKVNKDVTIDLNTSHTNIIFDTWNKGTIEIEAYIEGEDLSNEEFESALKKWDVDIDASFDSVSISTKSDTHHVWHYNYAHENNDVVHAVLDELKFVMADLPEMPEMPELPEMPEMPKLPELPEGVNDVQFDYEAYQKDGEKYLEKYTQKFESTFGKDYAKKMEAWGEKFGEGWGEKYGAQMEVWGERFAAQMEKRAERIENEVQRADKQRELVEKRRERVEVARKEHEKEREKLESKRRVLVEKMVNRESGNFQVKKTIRIKMPKGAKLKVNVRHGELEFTSNIDDLKADLSYTKFSAYSINGSSTSINASYSPIHVNHWNLGELNLKYVEDVDLDHVNNLILTSNSSNITVGNLFGNAIIDGSIGDLKILKIDDAFTNLNIIIQNSDVVIALPKVDYNLQYKGTRSHFYHPKKVSKENVSSFSNNILDSNKTIIVNAKYSNVELK
ncbi:hypothetical protein [Thalassobellus suaedae]|uniref:Adhesin domain-containing protein n=1 Tax=Thalassobellus suaedae TaxID=3074124 RepID=A0ABY9XW05_9FLAO|nr:hypothetical protein RHP51_05475 [Flavobacteriaceae bacterium HL-DH14]